MTDAVTLLATHGAGARILAGGQTLMPLMARRIARPTWIVDINRIGGLDGIELSSSHIRMGALVRQEQARRSDVARHYLAGVTEALAWVANPVVRQRGTVVGNLVTNSAGAELPAVALALRAEFVLRYPHGEDTVPAAALLGNAAPARAGALVTHVLWPRRAAPAGFFEVARRDGHLPVVSAMVSMNEEDCRVALSGVCATGLSCTTTARLIAREYPRLPSARELADALKHDLIGPVYSDAYSTARYRQEVAPEVILRALQRMPPYAGTGAAPLTL